MSFSYINFLIVKDHLLSFSFIELFVYMRKKFYDFISDDKVANMGF